MGAGAVHWPWGGTRGFAIHRPYFTSTLPITVCGMVRATVLPADPQEGSQERTGPEFPQPEGPPGPLPEELQGAASSMPCTLCTQKDHELLLCGIDLSIPALHRCDCHDEDPSCISLSPERFRLWSGRSSSTPAPAMLWPPPAWRPWPWASGCCAPGTPATPSQHALPTR